MSIQLSDAIDLGLATLGCNERPEGWRVAEFDTLIAYVHPDCPEILGEIEPGFENVLCEDVPELNEGERYAGIVIHENDLTSHHLILLPQQPKTHLTWDEAIVWAASVGAELPTRQEATLLHTNLKLAFEPTWYWTGEQHPGKQYAGGASRAWLQYFNDGTQYLSGKGYKGRVRAVRRVPITEN